MDQQNIERRVISVFAKQFSVAEGTLTRATGPEEIETWDSLNHMSLVAALETEFQTSFEVEEIMELEDIGATIDLIRRKLEGRTMKTRLTAEQVASFHEQGYVIAPSFYDREHEIEPIQRAIYDIIGLAVRRHGLAIERPSFSPDRFSAGFHELIARDRAYGSEIYDAVKLIPAFVRLAASEKNEDAIRQLRQTEVAGFISRGYGMRIDLPNEDHIRAAWHQEYLFQLRSLDGLIFWSPLQSMTAELGPVVLAHASHRQGIHSVTTNGSARGAYSWALVNEGELANRYEHVAPLTKPGDVLIMDFLTLHRSGVNSTNAARWSMQMRLFNFEESTGMRVGWPGSVADGVRFERFHPECLAADKECVS